MDIIYEFDSTTSQSAQSNEPQKVEIRLKEPNSSESEEVLKLKRDIESIDALMINKEEKIKKNQNKWYCKHYMKLAICMVSLFVISIISVPLALAVAVISKNCSALLISFIVFALAGFLAIAVDKSDKLSEQNYVLSSDLGYLQEIKRQKLLEIETLKRKMDETMEPTVAKTLPTSLLNKLRIYQEALKIIQNMEIEPTEIILESILERVVQVVEQIEEKGKQKTLGTK